MGKRQMLFESLRHLQANDVLVLDRGYPATWLIALLQQQSIRFCMRCDSDSDSGFKSVREFLRSGASEAMVSLNMPGTQDAKDDEFIRSVDWPISQHVICLNKMILHFQDDCVDSPHSGTYKREAVAFFKLG